MLLLVPVASAQTARTTDVVQSFGAVEQTPHPFPRVRDAVLRENAERVHGLLAAVIDRQLMRMSAIVDRAQSLLDRIADATESLARRGYDVSVVRERIAAARQAIDEAREAIRDQSVNNYVLDTATDATIRDRLRAVREQLTEDLGVIRRRVHAALTAVREAAQALRRSQPAS